MGKYNFSGKVTVVTGGASGIGEAICTAFASNNSDVVIIDINKDFAERLSKKIAAKYSINSSSYECDISDFTAVLQVS